MKSTFRRYLNNVSRGSSKDIRSDHLVVSSALMVIFGITGYTASRMWQQVQDNKLCSTWPATRGVVTNVKYPKNAHRVGNEPSKLRYKYSVVNKELQGTNHTLKMVAPSMGKSAMEKANMGNIGYRSPRYHVGDKVLVFYKPSDPSVSCLKPSSQREMMHLPDVMATTIMGGVAFFAALLAMKRMRLAVRAKSSSVSRK